MKEGWLSRSFEAVLQNGIKIKVHTKRFLSLDIDEVGAISYNVTPLNSDAKITYTPYLDAGITNEDTNWDDQFWDVLEVSQNNQQSFIEARTMKTHFYTCTFMESRLFVDNSEVITGCNNEQTSNYTSCTYQQEIKENQTFTIHKFGGYVVDRNHEKDELVAAAKEL